MRWRRNAAASASRSREAEYLAGWRAGYDEWDRLMGSFKQDQPLSARLALVALLLLSGCALFP